MVYALHKLTLQCKTFWTFWKLILTIILKGKAQDSNKVLKSHTDACFHIKFTEHGSACYSATDHGQSDENVSRMCVAIAAML